jgi:hypothetical protein
VRLSITLDSSDFETILRTIDHRIAHLKRLHYHISALEHRNVQNDLEEVVSLTKIRMKVQKELDAHYLRTIP